MSNDPTPIEKLTCRLVLDYLEDRGQAEAYCAILRLDPNAVEESYEYRQLYGSEKKCEGIAQVGTSNDLTNIITDYLAIQSIIKNFINDLPKSALKTELLAADNIRRKLQFLMKTFRANIEHIEVAKSMGQQDYSVENVTRPKGMTSLRNVTRPKVTPPQVNVERRNVPPQQVNVERRNVPLQQVNVERRNVTPPQRNQKRAAALSSIRDDSINDSSENFLFANNTIDLEKSSVKDPNRNLVNVRRNLSFRTPGNHPKIVTTRRSEPYREDDKMAALHLWKAILNDLSTGFDKHFNPGTKSTPSRRKN